MMMCWTSLQVRSGLASRARAMIAAAMGALALVPVCLVVQPWCKSVVTIWGSDVVPELEEKRIIATMSVLLSVGRIKLSI